MQNVLEFIREEIDATYRLHDDVNAADFAKSMAVWLRAIAWGLPTLSAFTVACNQFGMDPVKLQPLFRIYAAIQLKTIGVRMHHHASSQIDPTTPYVFLQNHINHFDFIACHNTSPHYRQGIELEIHFSYPLYGPFMKARGTVPVREGESGQSETLRERIREQLTQGRSLLAFPEAQRTTTGRLMPFRRGLFFIARDLDVPVVPVSCPGMYEVMRRGSVLIRPDHDVHVYMDAPIYPSDFDTIDAFVDAVYRVISERVDNYYEGRPQPPLG